MFGLRKQKLFKPPLQTLKMKHRSTVPKEEPRKDWDSFPLLTTQKQIPNIIGSLSRVWAMNAESATKWIRNSPSKPH